MKFRRGLPAWLAKLHENSIIQIQGTESGTEVDISQDSGAGVMTVAELEEHPAQMLLQVAKRITRKAYAAPSVPVYNSRIGAKATLFMDFDGRVVANWGSYVNINTPVYDTDGDPNTFSAAELNYIHEIFRRVAEDYAPFDVNVTTVDPGNVNNGQTAVVAIGGSYTDWYLQQAGGVAYVGGFYNSAPNVGYCFPAQLGPGLPKYVAECVSHESGHLFGLRHQAAYNGTIKTADYSQGNPSWAPIMGVGYYSIRTTWHNGPSDLGSTALQDDLTILANASNAFGYLPDDHGDTADMATPFAVDVNNPTSVSASGLIGNNTDKDYFFANVGSGAVQFQVTQEAGITNLDGSIEIWDSTGTTLIEPTTPAASVSATLAAGDYRIVVKSSGGYGNLGRYSVSGTIVAPLVGVNAPTSVSISALSATSIRISWADNSSNETNFEIIRSLDGSTWSALATPGADVTSYTDTNAVAGNSYRYGVRGAQGAVKSAYSYSTTLMLPPPVVTISNIVANSSVQVVLSWNDVAGETGYLIERSLDQLSWVGAGQVAANVTSLTDNGRAPLTTYYYRVKSLNAGGSSAPSAIVNVTTPAGPSAPAAPSGLVASATAHNQVVLGWSDNSNNETGFQLERSTNSAFSVVASVQLAAASTSYTDNSVQMGTSYWYRVRATNANGNSAYSTAASVTTPGVPTAPTNAAATALSSSQIRITWNDVANETGYRVERVDGAVVSVAGQVSAGVLTFTESALSPSTTYSYRVVAFNAAGDSAPSAPLVSATTFASVPTLPTNLNATMMSPYQVMLTWTDNSINETSYVVQRSESNGVWKTVAPRLATNTVQYVDASLSGNRTYMFRVYAINAGGSSGYSNVVAVSTPAVPKNKVSGGNK